MPLRIMFCPILEHPAPPHTLHLDRQGIELLGDLVGTADDLVYHVLTMRHAGRRKCASGDSDPVVADHQNLLQVMNSSVSRDLRLLRQRGASVLIDRQVGVRGG